MSGKRRVTVEPGVEVELPSGWVVEADAEGGSNLSAEDGVGLLHLVLFEQEPDLILDPAEELYAFLEDQGIELEEDEVEDVELAGDGLLALCEYLTEVDPEETAGTGASGDDEDEADEPATYWLVGVATEPGRLLFGSYSCPAGEQERERETVRGILSSLRLVAGSG